MPSKTSTNRVESKFNVTTDFPHLGLHSAAANGNIGLVQYALSHGQPINSVLDGVLPLHAASSGGNDLVVKLLIDQGADVNAARLPRRYSSHSRTHAASSSHSAHPTIGSSGSTPLHFAAANGHANVVRLLLLHGAHADRRDKHGVTPEMLARDCGNEEVVELLREWVINKDRDLRERGEAVAGATGSGPGSGVAPVGGGGGTGTKPTNGGWGIGTGRDDDDDEDTRERKLGGGRLKVKASIDQALNSLRSAASTQSHCPTSAEPEDIGFPRTSSSSGGRRPSFPDYGTPSYYSHSSARRPHSAGQGAQPPDEQEERQRLPSTASRKLASKYSLRNLFKKANDSATPSSAEPSYTTTPDLSASPSPGPSANIPLPNTGGAASPRMGGVLPLESSPLANTKGHRARAPSDSDSSFSQGMYHRTRSASGSGAANINEDEAAVMSGNGSAGSVRPSILRTHRRTSSSNGGSSALPPSRAIRFDDSGGSSQTSLVSKARNGVARALGGLERSLSPGRGGVKKSGSVASLVQEENSGAKVKNGGEDGDEEEYGEVIRNGEAKPRLSPFKADSAHGHRGRGASFASSTYSLSPIFLPDSTTQDQGHGFPFNIDHPPPMDEHLLSVPPLPQEDDGEQGGGVDEKRQRGGSVSSASTDNMDANPQLSWSSSTTGTGSSVATSGAETLLAASSPSVSGRKMHVPVDIDIRSISSHAQAEVLVQRAQQSILEMDISSDGKEGSSGGLPSPLFDGDELGGRSPLSARLAAYGETLALERRLKQAEQDLNAKKKDSEEGASPTLVLFTRDRDRDSNRSPRVRDGRALIGGSETASRPMNPSRARIRQPMRPKTSDSVSSNKPPSIFTVDRPRAHHQISRSTSAVETEPPALSTKDDMAIIETAYTPVPSPPTFLHDLPTITTSMDSQPASNPDTDYSSFPTLTRSRTPDPPSPNDSAIRTNIPLSRCSTAPAQDSFLDDISVSRLGRNLKVDPATRHIATASKLTRMGFSAQAQPPVSQDSTKSSRFGIKSLFKSGK